MADSRVLIPEIAPRACPGGILRRIWKERSREIPGLSPVDLNEPEANGGTQ
jgi:hypothetical protein